MGVLILGACFWPLKNGLAKSGIYLPVENRDRIPVRGVRNGKEKSAVSFREISGLEIRRSYGVQKSGADSVNQTPGVYFESPMMERTLPLSSSVSIPLL